MGVWPPGPPVSHWGMVASVPSVNLPTTRTKNTSTFPAPSSHFSPPVLSKLKLQASHVALTKTQNQWSISHV